MNVAITINGKKRFVQDRITVFEACRQSGVYVPHFCYHPKMTIPANCRMCLVQVEKMPKPVPACATYVSDGMVIRTNSEMSKSAQKNVMEFLLINHPLDCPICDQGGECQLQDLSVGYGHSCSRYGESKRVVVEKHLGPLISTVMTRCIHCTRCVRFGQEIANNMELGMVGRGEHSEIMPFIESTVDSELSGNMIDVCPVGALNSKPFRFSARTWEMDRADGVSPHDSFGSFLRFQSIDGKIKRVVPRNHEEINECWLSDRDRFSYIGVNSQSRLLAPMLRDTGSVKARRVEWPEALEGAQQAIQKVTKEHGPGQVGILIGPSSVSEVGLLASEFATALGTGNIDHRLRQRDFSLDPHQIGVPWFGTSLEALDKLEQILIVGANMANELPLLPQRLRRLQRRKLKAHSIVSRSIASQIGVENEILATPLCLLPELAKVALAAAGDDAPAWLKDFGTPEKIHGEMAEALKSGQSAVVLGAEAILSKRYGAMRAVASELAKSSGGFHGMLADGGNTVGNTLAGAVPHFGFMLQKVPSEGLNSRQMIEEKLKCYILIGCEPADFYDAKAAAEAFRNAVTIHIGGYVDVAREYSDVLLPSGLFAEQTGATVNLEGNAATMYAAVDPPGEAKPTWKIIRALAGELGLDSLDYDTLEHVRARLITAGDFTKKLNNEIRDIKELPGGSHDTASKADGLFERIPEVAHFGTDQVVRRAEPLQETMITVLSSSARLHPSDMGKIGVSEGGSVRLAANGAAVECEAYADPELAQGCVRCPMAVDVFAPLGGATQIEVSAVGEQRKSAVAGG